MPSEIRITSSAKDIPPGAVMVRLLFVDSTTPSVVTLPVVVMATGPNPETPFKLSSAPTIFQSHHVFQIPTVERPEVEEKIWVLALFLMNATTANCYAAKSSMSSIG